ncbi:putative aldouronate transport system permease protein [Pullulanibacillus pueri]|uniref:Sugar ABC transporter permease n=1 Tax=Pullulanibacillus pueri TaxID=1437324 RepID=A0A8J2ZZN2_9BACL|nr:carbohydrate ABC transporter permease [Pullulanibacillus pueri]MBM7683315.1 putative aldouronate transport system permease protein [Pullulanibacillus pueri]GGH86415.1 sugar ABC transporter permease [Pullulanibacillus pueri]
MTAKKSTIKDTFGDKVFLTVIYIFLILVILVILYPLIYIVSSSFSSPLAVSSGKVWLWPVHFSLEGYKAVFNNSQVIVGYANSLFYTFFGTLISVTLTVLFAYPLSRKSFFGRGPLMFFILFTMLFSGGLIPEYLIVKDLHMLDTRWAMLIPKAIAVWQVIIARTFFQTSIPDELVEASEMDGCSDLRFLMSIVIPLSKPIIAVLVLMYAVFQWNSYFDAMIYLKSESLFPLQVVLRNILIVNTTSSAGMDAGKMMELKQLADLMKYSLIVVASIPVLIIYPFVQRHFMKGVMIGSIKG